MSFLTKCRCILSNLETIIAQTLGTRASGSPFPALALDVHPIQKQPDSRNTGQSLLDSLLDNGFLWAAVPKRRRSRERRMIRKFGYNKVQAYMTPKKNIVPCLECGHWHEVHTICGNCYEKVREETDVMRESLAEDVRLYNHPDTEVAYVYQGEDKDKARQEGRYVVEVERPRPEWFSKALLTKGHGKYSQE